MHLELSIVPEGIGTADLLKIVNASGMHYQVTEEGTILEGRRCSSVCSVQGRGSIGSGPQPMVELPTGVRGAQLFPILLNS